MAEGRIQVAVIGAGLCGIIATKRLLEKPDVFEVFAYEKSSNIGGQWVYTEITNTAEKPHSAVYHNLVTNIPKETMVFPDFPLKSEGPSYISHKDVRQYINDYAGNFDLKRHIQFNTTVEWVEPVEQPGGAGVKWKLTVCPSGSPSVTQTVNAVMVCNGHESEGMMPDLPGLASFSGKILHSHDYRRPEDYRDQTVVCLGSMFSAQDITLHVSQCAKKVYLSHWRPEPMPSVFPANVEQRAGVVALDGSTVILSDGSNLQADAIIFCTGYHYSLSFLAPECGISVKDQRVMSLYKHVINIAHPSMSFIGITRNGCPSPTFDSQVRFALASLDGTMQLPSQETMRQDADHDLQRRLDKGWPARHAHIIYTFQQDYYKDLATLGKFPMVPQVIPDLFDHVAIVRENELTTFKKINYRIIDDKTFEEIRP